MCISSERKTRIVARWWRVLHEQFYKWHRQPWLNHLKFITIMSVCCFLLARKTALVFASPNKLFDHFASEPFSPVEHLFLLLLLYYHIYCSWCVIEILQHIELLLFDWNCVRGGTACFSVRLCKISQLHKQYNCIKMIFSPVGPQSANQLNFNYLHMFICGFMVLDWPTKQSDYQIGCEKLYQLWCVYLGSREPMFRYFICDQNRILWWAVTSW